MNTHNLIERSAQQMGSGEITLEEYLIVSAAIAGCLNGSPIGYGEISRITDKSNRSIRRSLSLLEKKGLVTRRQIRGSMRLYANLSTQAAPTKAKREYVKVPQAWRDRMNKGRKVPFTSKQFTTSAKDTAKVKMLVEKNQPSDLNDDFWKSFQKAKVPLGYLATVCNEAGEIKPENRTKPTAPKPTTPKREEAETIIEEPVCTLTPEEKKAQMNAAFSAMEAVILNETPKHHRRN